MLCDHRHDIKVIKRVYGKNVENSKSYVKLCDTRGFNILRGMDTTQGVLDINFGGINY